MNPRSKTFLPLDSAFPFKGLNVSAPASMLDAHYSPSMENVLVDQGLLQTRKGYTKLGGAVKGTIQAEIDFEKASGVVETVLVTTTNLYTYDSTSEDWVDITKGNVVDTCETGWTASAEVTATYPTTDKKVGAKSLLLTCTAAFGAVPTMAAYKTLTSTNLTSNTCLDMWVKSSVALSANDWDVVVADTTNGGVGTHHTHFAIPALSAGVWTHVQIAGAFTDLTDAQSVGIWQRVDKGAMTLAIDHIRASVLLTGSESNEVSWTIGESVDADTTYSGKFLYITNGVDHPLQWDGSTATAVNMVCDLPGLVTCKTLCVYLSYLIMANITATTSNKQEVDWTAAGDFTNWTTGDAGGLILPSLSGEILLLRVLGDRVMIYSKDSIGALLYLGGTIVFGQEVLVTNTRLLSARSVVSIGPFHFFLGGDSVYLFDGTRAIRPLSDVVMTWIRDSLYRDYAYRCMGFNDAPKHQVYWTVPVSATRCKTLVMDYDIYDPSNIKWMPYEYADIPQAFGVYVPTTGSTYKWSSSAITGQTWAQTFMTWDQGSAKSGYPVRMMASGSQAFLCADTQVLDDGVAQGSNVQTIDFTVPSTYITLLARWTELELELEGAGITIEYSTGGGWVRTWSTFSPVGLERRRYFLDTTSRKLAIRISTTSGWFRLRWLRVWLQPSTDR